MSVTTIRNNTSFPVLTPQTFDQLVMFAEYAATSGLVPKDYENKPGAIIIAVQMGAELGLSPMQSVVSIAVINGRPGVWGDGMIGLCRQSPHCEDIIESFEGEGDALKAICIAKRRGATPVRAEFSVADAKLAGLWTKPIWKQYPRRMLTNRARSFALRDAFPDVLRGLKAAEELLDIPPEPSNWTRVHVDKRPPEQPAKPTIDDFLTKWEGLYAAAQTIDELRALDAHKDVLWAEGPAGQKRGARDEMLRIKADHFERVRDLEAQRAEERKRQEAESQQEGEDPIEDDENEPPF